MPRRRTSIALLALVPLLAASCGDNGKKAKSVAQATTPTGSTGTQVATSPVPTPTTKKPAKSLILQSLRGARAQTLDLYPLLNGDLSRNAGGQVVGTGVTVVKVVGPTSFWAGRGLSSRLLVHIHLKGRPKPSLHAGQLVDITGLLTKSSSTFGVKDAAGRALLKKQGAYAEISIGDLKPY